MEHEVEVSTIETQCIQVLTYLKTHDCITDNIARDLFGINRLGARIFDLRRNHKIITTMKTGENRFGRKPRYAEYRLAE